MNNRLITNQKEKSLFSFAIFGAFKNPLSCIGVLWIFLKNHLIQMLTYWFVFSTGIRNSKPVITGIGEVPFIVWMLAGLMKMNFPIRSLQIYLVIL
ncbi:hypothetical protein AU385_05430 [Bacillus halotolerans]|nr:hypothetical protein AU385_05430 [Bacillus halotolerans]